MHTSYTCANICTYININLKKVGRSSRRDIAGLKPSRRRAPLFCVVDTDAELGSMADQHESILFIECVYSNIDTC